jgi:RimJ/RimL family protein N-acetyltransferase
LNDEKGVRFLFDTRRHPAVCIFLFGKPPPDWEYHKRWLESDVPHKRIVYLLKLDDEYIGYCHSSNCSLGNKTLEAGFVIHPDYHGKGYGKAMVGMFIDMLAENFIGWKVLLEVKDTNPIALHVYDKNGFIRTSEEDGVVTMEKQL